MAKYKYTTLTMGKAVDGIVFITLVHNVSKISFSFILTKEMLNKMSFLNQEEVDAEFSKIEEAEETKKTGLNENHILQELRFDIFTLVNAYL